MRLISAPNHAPRHAFEGPNTPTLHGAIPPRTVASQLPGADPLSALTRNQVSAASLRFLGAPSCSAAWRFIRTSLCTTPPLLFGFALFESPMSNPPLPEGRLDLLKGPRSNPPLPEGRLDFLKSPRSNPPLPEGRLDFRKSPKSNPPPRFQETLQKRSG